MIEFETVELRLQVVYGSAEHIRLSQCDACLALVQIGNEGSHRQWHEWLDRTLTRGVMAWASMQPLAGNRVDNTMDQQAH